MLGEVIQIVGSQRALAESLGVSLQAVNQWVNGRRRIPPKQASRIEKLTGGRVTAASLRPDLAEIFGPTATKEAA